jgi:transposase
MEYGAIDLDKRESQVRILSESGEVVDRRIQTTRDRFTAMFGARLRMRILLEASTESEWVAQHLESLGHEVVVADPNYLPMYGHRSRRVKTDQRDVAALTEACQRGIYRVVHRRSARQQSVQSQLNVRQELVQARTRAISLARAITRAAGLRVRSGRTETFLTRLDALDLPASMKATLLPLRSVIEVLDDELASADDQFTSMVSADAVVKRLTTLPNIGPITASAYVAAFDDVSRFSGAGQVTCYLGLVPREYSSGEQQRRGRILRSAHPHVQCCWCKRRGACRDHLLQTRPLCALGRRRSLAGVGRKSPWSRSLGVSHAFCLRCGETRSNISPIEFEDSRRSP